MTKNLYRKVLQKLLECFGKNLQGHPLKRVKKLAGLICGLLRKKKPDMDSLGFGIDTSAEAHSRQKAAAAFLHNKWVDYDTFYFPFLQELLRAITSNPNFEIRLVIDGSKMGSSHMVLMISLYYKGRGIPLVWLVHKKKKGHFDSATHLELVETAKTLLAPYVKEDYKITLLGDGEFGNVDLQAWCKEAKWNYVFRIAKNTHLYEEGKDEEGFQPKDLKLLEGQEFMFFSNVDCTEKRLEKVSFVLWHDPKYEDPLPLVSNLKEAMDIIENYDLRYSIECLFKDMKSTTFNLNKTRLRSAQAISNLVMVGAFALTLLLKVGLKYEKDAIRKKVQRVRPDRVVHTLISYGFKLLDYLLDRGIAFCFRLNWSDYIR